MKVTRMISFRKLNRIWEFLSFLTGSHESDFEDQRRRSVLAFFLIISIGIAFPFSIHHFSIGNVSRAIILLCLGSVQFFSLMALRFLRRANIIFRLNVILLGIYFLFLIYIGGTQGSRILWAFIFPIFAFFLLGKKEGLFWSVLIILFSVLLFINPANFFETYPYENVIKTRFVITYTILVLMGYFVEATRQRYHEGVQDYAGFLSTLAAIRGLGAEKSEAELWQVFLSSMIKEYGFIMMWYGSYSGGRLVPKHSAGRADRYLDDLVLEIREPTLPDARCAMSRAILDDQPFGYEDLAKDEGFRQWRDYALELGYRSNIALPFKVNGWIEGGIMIYAGTVAAFPAKRVEHLHHLTTEMENTLQERRQIRQAKVALQNSYEQLERRVEERTVALKEAYDIINKSPTVAFLWINEEGWPVEFVSENVKELFGYTVKDFVSGKVPYTATIHPDDLVRVANEVTTFGAEEGRKTVAHEPYRIITKNGKVKWVNDRTNIRKDKKGRITHYQGIVEDISERKRAEQNLRQSERTVRSLLDALPAAAYLIDTQNQILASNKVFAGSLGKRIDNIVGEKIEDLTTGELFEKNRRKALEVIQSKNRFDMVSKWNKPILIPLSALYWMIRAMSADWRFSVVTLPKENRQNRKKKNYRPCWLSPKNWKPLVLWRGGLPMTSTIFLWAFKAMLL